MPDTRQAQRPDRSRVGDLSEDARSTRWMRSIAFAGRHRLVVLVAVDSLAWAVGLFFAVAVRLDFDLARADVRGWAVLAVLAAAAQGASGALLGPYLGRSRFGSFDEVAGLVRATALATMLLFVLNLAVPRQLLPRSAILAGGVTALVVMSGLRYTWRLVRERQRRPKGDDCERLLVFGAGEGGHQVITAMMRDPASPFLPVALLDDDPRKRNLRMSGVPVVGTRADLVRAAVVKEADTLLIAIPSAGADLVAALTDLAGAAGLAVKVLPPVGELFGGVGVADIRDPTPSDFLGRHEIEIDLASIAGYITDRRVLVTGAGGTIGSELCRQVSRLAPSELIMVDRDDSALHGVEFSISGRALLDSPDLVLLDIRDGARLKRLFAERRPQVVFHAAALKHQPLLELYPGEAVEANVWGTHAVLEAAASTGVARFVNISTDKAADPISVLGYSKRVAERLTAHIASRTAGTYLSVRFGNVLGSRGSMLGTFQAQIQGGGPITVTDPEVTRYFMTVEESVRLVIQAGAVGRDGEALVLDMGQPVRIADVARRLADLAQQPVEIVYTGLRRGEKLHEVLLGRDEVDERPAHPLVSHVVVPPLHPDVIRDLDTAGSPDAIIAALAELCSAPPAGLPVGAERW